MDDNSTMRGIMKRSVKKFKSINLNPSPTLLSNQFCDSSRH